MSLRKRVVLGPTLGALFLLTTLAGPVVAASADISGTVPKNGTWAYYSTRRCTTTSGRPDMRVYTWPGGSRLSAYVRNDAGNPIGYGSPNSPVQWQVNDNTIRALGDFSTGTCFRLTARKDSYWPWAEGSEWWTGYLWW